jgi:hypothetical protein
MKKCRTFRQTPEWTNYFEEKWISLAGTMDSLLKFIKFVPALSSFEPDVLPLF